MIQGTRGGAGLGEQGGQLFIVRGVEAEHMDSDADGWWLGSRVWRESGGIWKAEQE